MKLTRRFWAGLFRTVSVQQVGYAILASPANWVSPTLGGMMILTFVFLFLGAAVFSILYIYIFQRIQDQTLKQWEPERQLRDRARCEYIEEGLQEWLKMLELPQFEDQMILQAAAHQLRIVLVEQLVRGPRVR